MRLTRLTGLALFLGLGPVVDGVATAAPGPAPAVAPGASPEVSPAASPGPARGATRSPPPLATDDVEEVEDARIVTTAVTQGAGGPPKAQTQRGLARVLPRLHVVLVHFPIAWLVLLLLIDIRTVAWAKPGWERLGLLVLGLTLLSMALATLTGFLRADQLPRAPDAEALLMAHRNLALLTAGVTAAALGLRLARGNHLTGPWRWIYLALLATAVGLVLLTGHRGGALVFGPGFLAW